MLREEMEFDEIKKPYRMARCKKPNHLKESNVRFGKKMPLRAPFPWSVARLDSRNFQAIWYTVIQWLRDIALLLLMLMTDPRFAEGD
jgi:hypothetical protein